MQETDPGISELAAIQPITDELRANPHVLALILSGSGARGRPRKNSDIDLCIVTKKDIPESEKMDFFSYSSGKIEVSFFQDLPIMIQFQKLRKGKVIGCKNSREFNAIVADTIREYHDFEPVFRKLCRLAKSVQNDRGKNSRVTGHVRL